MGQGRDGGTVNMNLSLVGFAIPLDRLLYSEMYGQGSQEVLTSDSGHVGRRQRQTLPTSEHSRIWQSMVMETQDFHS